MVYFSMGSDFLSALCANENIVLTHGSDEKRKNDSEEEALLVNVNHHCFSVSFEAFLVVSLSVFSLAFQLLLRFPSDFASAGVSQLFYK